MSTELTNFLAVEATMAENSVPAPQQEDIEFLAEAAAVIRAHHPKPKLVAKTLNLIWAPQGLNRAGGGTLYVAEDFRFARGFCRSWSFDVAENCFYNAEPVINVRMGTPWLDTPSAPCRQFAVQDPNAPWCPVLIDTSAKGFPLRMSTPPPAEEGDIKLARSVDTFVLFRIPAVSMPTKAKAEESMPQALKNDRLQNNELTYNRRLDWLRSVYGNDAVQHWLDSVNEPLADEDMYGSGVKRGGADYVIRDASKRIGSLSNIFKGKRQLPNIKSPKEVEGKE